MSAIQNVGRGGVRRTSPPAFAILTNCSATNHREVFLISPLSTKINPLSKTWAGVECERQASRRRGLSDYARKNQQNSRSKFRYPLLRTTERCSSAHSCPQKISATINGYGYFWWAGVDSDHRSQVTTDLQSVPFGRSGTYPYMWSWRLESNPQPADYKSAALPIELHQQFF